MAKPRRAYTVEGRRFTPSQFERLSRARKVAGMVEWFASNFEDPANQVSYQTREGGYLWGGSGPHDADEELQEEFGDVASYEDIQAAVEEVQNEGTIEWASSRFFREQDDEPEDDFDEDGNRSIDRPMPDLSDDARYDEGVVAGEVVDGDGDWPPLIGVPAEERDLRSEVVAALDQFDVIAAAVLADRVRRGHNHPPEMVEDDEELPWVELNAARDAASELRDETGLEEPDTGRIISAIQRVKNFTAKLGARLSRLTRFVGSAVVAGAAWDGAKGAYQNPTALYEAAVSLTTTASEWVQHLGNFW